jgi:hypothetical protein
MLFFKSRLKQTMNNEESQMIYFLIWAGICSLPLPAAIQA